MPVPTRFLGDALDLSPRVVHTAAITGSPAAAAETIVATLQTSRDVALGLGVVLFGYVAYTVGGSGTAVQLRIRQTDTSGTVIKASGALTRTAGNLQADSICGVDLTPAGPGQVYVLTMIVTAGAATSTVSAVTLAALLV